MRVEETKEVDGCQNIISKENMLKLYSIYVKKIKGDEQYICEYNKSKLVDNYGNSLLSIWMEEGIVLGVHSGFPKIPISEIIKEMIKLKIIE